MLQLCFQPVRHGNIIRIHAGDKLAVRVLQTVVECLHHSFSRVIQYPQAAIFPAQAVNGGIFAVIIDQE